MNSSPKTANINFDFSCVKCSSIIASLILASPFVYFIARLTKYKVLYIYVAVILLFLFLVSAHYLNTLAVVLKKNLMMIVLFGSFFLSALWSLYPEETLRSSAIIALYLVIHLVFCFVVLKASPHHIGLVYKLLPIFLFALNLFFIARYGNIRIESENLKEVIISSGYQTTTVDRTEVKAAIHSYPNHMGAVTEICMPFLFFFFRFSKNKLFVIFLIIINIFNIMVSQSRGAYLILVLSLIMIPLLYNRNFFKFVSSAFLWILICALVYGALSLIPVTGKFMDVIEHRILATELSPVSFETEDISESGKDMIKRDLMYAAGVHIIKKKPLSGIGYGSFKYYIKDMFGRNLIPHNIFITLWTGSGILAVLLFASIIIKAFRNLWLKFRHLKNTDRLLSYWFLTNCIALFFLLVHGQFRPLLNNPVFYLPLAVGLMCTITPVNMRKTDDRQTK